MIWAARRPGVLAGLDCARLALAELAPEARFNALARDGDTLSPGQVLARAEAPARAVLAAERTGLNLMGRLSGIATLTRAYVEAVAGTGVRITDTRKTTPGLRQLEKYAVRCGIRPALERARAAAGHLVKVEIEVDGLDQLAEALPLSPDVIMLDNFSLSDLRKAVAMTAGRVTLEASGGVDLTTVRSIAETGVQVISVGALTHSAPGLDIGLDAA